MSTRRTVEVRVSCSVRKTSKSPASRSTPAVGREARGVLRPAKRVLDRAPDVEMERVAELVRLRRLLALPSPPGPVDPMAAERVARQPREQVVEDLLADPPAAPRRQLEAIAAAAEVAGPFELAGKLVERVQVAGGLVAEQLADVARGRDPARSPGPATSASESSSASSAWSRPICSSAGSRPEPLLAAEVVALAEAVRHELVHVRGEPGEVPAQPVVAEQRVHHRLELGPLLGGHRAQERLHRRHPLGELLDDVVERPGAGEELAVPREEVVDLVLAGLAALQAVLEERVEVADHLAVRLELLRRRALDRLGQALDEPVERLAAEPIRRAPSNRSRAAGSMKSYSSSAADPAADVRRQRLELVEPAGGRVAEHRELESRVDRGAVRRRGCVVEPALDAGPLVGHDLVELLPDVGQDVAAADSAPAAPRAGGEGVRAGRRGRAGRGRVGSRPRQPRSISRRSASPRSPSAMTSSASASMISSASRAGIVWLPSQRAYRAARASSGSRADPAADPPSRSRRSGM